MRGTGYVVVVEGTKGELAEVYRDRARREVARAVATAIRKLNVRAHTMPVGKWERLQEATPHGSS